MVLRHCLMSCTSEVFVWCRNLLLNYWGWAEAIKTTQLKRRDSWECNAQKLACYCSGFMADCVSGYLTQQMLLWAVFSAEPWQWFHGGLLVGLYYWRLLIRRIKTAMFLLLRIWLCRNEGNNEMKTNREGVRYWGLLWWWFLSKLTNSVILLLHKRGEILKCREFWECLSSLCFAD